MNSTKINKTKLRQLIVGAIVATLLALVADNVMFFDHSQNYSTYYTISWIEAWIGYLLLASAMMLALSARRYARSGTISVNEHIVNFVVSLVVSFLLTAATIGLISAVFYQGQGPWLSPNFVLY